MRDNLIGNFDAYVWAKAFVKRVEADPRIATNAGALVTWFANAIMAGYDQAKREET